MFGESIKSQLNINKKKELISNFMKLSVNKSMTDNQMAAPLKVNSPKNQSINLAESSPRSDRNLIKLHEKESQHAIDKIKNKKVIAMLSEHSSFANRIDFIGSLINIIFVPASLYGFVFFLAQRLDGENNVSFFILLIPIWVGVIPLIAYTVLCGVASKNLRISRCEKILLSLSVPLGFLITGILLVLYVENKLPNEFETIQIDGQ